MEEIWKDIQGYEGLYMVSNLGRVKSLNYHNTGKEGILKEYIDKRKNHHYHRVTLSKNGKTDRISVHVLVALVFIPNPNNLPEVNHKDENPHNNIVDNLEWCNRSYNINYGTRNKRVGKANCKTVYQLTLNGELVKIWESSYEVAHQLGYSHSLISRCCRGKGKTAYGYKWVRHLP